MIESALGALGIFVTFVLVSGCIRAEPNFMQSSPIYTDKYFSEGVMVASSSAVEPILVSGPCEESHIEYIEAKIPGYLGNQWLPPQDFAVNGDLVIECDREDGIYSFKLLSLATFGIWDLSEPQRIQIFLKASGPYTHPATTKLEIDYIPPKRIRNN